jgi:hypothetical protein
VSRETNSKKAWIGWAAPLLFSKKRRGAANNDTAGLMIKANGNRAFGNNPGNAAYRKLQLRRIMRINADIGLFTKPLIVTEHPDCKSKGQKNESRSLCE